MRIVQSTWNRFHHFDLARELQKLGHLERIFTSLPWWKVDKESKEQNIPKELISSNPVIHGIRHLGAKLPWYNQRLDDKLAILQAENYGNWVAKNLPDCEAYIALSGSGLRAGKVAKKRGAGYIMDRGSAQQRWVERENQREALRWGIPVQPTLEWLVQNEEEEEAEANLISVPSDFAARTFIEMGVPISKLRVVPYGVDLKEFHKVGQPSNNEFRLLFVGGARLVKGIGYLLQAFEKFKHPNKRLVFVGAIDPAIVPIFKSFSSVGIEFVGSVPRAEVKKYMSISHALVLSSIHEGLALVQGQAMACGTPVIATRNTGSENLFEHEQQGLIIEARNVNALVDAFTRLADEPALRESMSVACLERVKQIGGWETYAERMVEISREAKAIASKQYN
jgi:alpha-maltose-1-phosphate synthase